MSAKLFFKLKLVTDNLSIQQPTDKPLKVHQCIDLTFHSIYYKGRKGKKGRHNTRFNTDAHSSRSRNTRCFVFTYATRLSTIEVSTANANHPHQRLTSQLLCGSALLPRLPTLKLFNLPVASGASFLHVHGNAMCLALIVYRQ